MHKTKLIFRSNAYECLENSNNKVKLVQATVSILACAVIFVMIGVSIRGLVCRTFESDETVTLHHSLMDFLMVLPASKRLLK